MSSTSNDAHESLQASLEREWAAVAQDFREKTKQDLRRPPPSFEEVQKRLSDRYEPKEREEQRSKRRASENLEIALKCVTRVAQVGTQIAKFALDVASAASVTYPPAQVCINAISYLVEIPGKVSNYYSRFADLFQEIVFFLRQFKIYREIEQAGSMTRELFDSTQELLRAFVKICAEAYRPIKDGKLKRIVSAAKFVFTSDDSGVQSALDDFQKLVERQNSTIGLITLENSLKGNRHLSILIENQLEDRRRFLPVLEGVQSLTEDMVKRKGDAENQAKLKQVAEALELSYEDSVTKQYQVLSQISQRPLHTGAWLGGQTEYQTWLRAGSEQHPALYICGERGTGKSGLIRRIMQDIKDRHEPTKSVPIAAFSFDQGNEQLESRKFGEKLSPRAALSLALRAVALQVAEQNRSYLRVLQDIADSKDFRDALELEDCHPGRLFELLEFFPKRNKLDRDIPFHVIPDGLEANEATNELFARIDEMWKTLGNTQMADHAFVAFKVVAIGPETILPSNTQDRSAGVAKVLVQETGVDGLPANFSDLIKYTDRQIQNDGALKAVEDKYPDFFQNMYKDFARVARGSYWVIQNKLSLMRDEIDKGLQDKDVLTGIMQRDPAKEEDAVKKVFTELEAKLESKELEQLNRIIAWYLEGCRWFSVEEMDAIIELDPAIATIQSFSYKIRNKKLLQTFVKIYEPRDADGQPVLKFDDDVWDVLTKAGLDPAENSEVISTQDATISMDLRIQINNASQEAVRRFFWDLSERASFGHFDFGSGNEITSSRKKIQPNIYRSVPTILLTLLDLLNGTVNCGVRSLYEYAAQWTPYYLNLAYRQEQKLQGLSRSAQYANKAKIVSKVLRFLMNPEHGFQYFKDVSHRWFEPDEAKAMNSWINPGMIQTTSIRDRSEFKEFLEEHPKPNELYTPLAMNYAIQWLTEDSWDAKSCYFWLDRFLEMRDKPLDGSEESPAPTEKKASPADSATEGEMKNSEKLRRALDFAKTIPSYRADRLWYKRLGETCHTLRLFDTAIENYVRAQELSTSDEPEIRRLVAMSLDGAGKLTEAIEELKRAIALWEAKGPEQSRSDLSAGRSARLTLASWYIKAGDDHAAFDVWRSLIQRDSHDYEAYWESMQKADELTRTDVITGIFSDFETEKQPERLAGLLNYVADQGATTDIEFNVEGVYLNQMLFMAQEAGKLDLMRDALDMAIKDVGPKLWLQKAILLCAKGTANLYHDSQEGHVAAGAALDEALREFDGDRDTNAHWAKLQTERRSSLWYLIEGQKTNFASPPIEKRLKEIWERSDWHHYPGQLAGFLAHYLVRAGRPEEARRLMLADVKNAFEALTDEVEGNDLDGYALLSSALLHAGDERNALAAWSLIRPYESKQGDEKNSTDEEPASPKFYNGVRLRDGPFETWCDGNCGTKWEYSDDTWWCKICSNTCFCGPCHQDILEGKSKLCCHKTHAWLHIPPFSDEEMQTVGRDNVRIPESDDPSEVRKGEILPIKDWVNRIGKEWNLAKAGLPSKDDEVSASEPGDKTVSE